jgi:hypothetical protein
VEGLHRRHAPRGQLAADLAVQPHKHCIAVAPLADALRADRREGQSQALSE